MTGNRKNGVGTAHGKLSLDVPTARILEGMVPAGIYGKNRSEVASYILRTWLRENRDELREFGVSLVRRRTKK